MACIPPALRIKKYSSVHRVFVCYIECLCKKALQFNGIYIHNVHSKHRCAWCILVEQSWKDVLRFRKAVHTHSTGLQQEISAAVITVSEETIAAVVRNFRRRLQMVLDADGTHVEHFM